MKRLLMPRSLPAICLLMFGLCTASNAVGQDDDGQEKFQEGQRLLNEGKFEEAAKAFKAVVEADDENAGAAFFLGYTLHMSGNLEEALKAHKHAATFEQFEGIATFNIGCANALLNNRDAAIEALNDAVKLGYQDENQFATDGDLDSLRLDNRFAVLMARVIEDEELEEALEKAQELLNDQDFAAAADVYQGVVDEHKDNGFVAFRLGYALHGAGKIDEAIELHERAAKHAPFRGIATYNLGCAYSLKGEKDLAIEALTKAVDAGFVRLDYMNSDSDLDSLREDERFVSLLEKVEDMAKKSSSDGDKENSDDD